MKCPYCNKEHADTAKFCEETGKPLEPQVKYCKNNDCDYRSPLPLSAQFCPNCGRQLNIARKKSSTKRVNSRISITTNEAGCEIFDDQFDKLIELPKGVTTLGSSRYPWLKTSFNLNFKTEHIVAIDLSEFVTSEFESFEEIFLDCNNLESINLHNLDTSNVKNMSGMFRDCRKLKHIDLSDFDTSQVTNMSHMFEDCCSLENIDLTGLDTSRVTDMSHMFHNCHDVRCIDLSGLDTSSVGNMNSMFEFCNNLIVLRSCFKLIKK